MKMRFGILTASDRSARGVRNDESGPALAKEIQSKGWIVIHQSILPDDHNQIRETLIAWADHDEVDIILTTGGTGFAPRDVTPEATISVVDRLAPSLAEAMRMESLRITPHAMLSRAVAGIRGKVLIINLPGSPKAAVENFRIVSPVLEHAVEILRSYPLGEEHHSQP